MDKNVDTVHTHTHTCILSKHKINIIIAYLIVFVVTICQISLIFNNNLWADECFTINTIKLNWSSFWKTLIEDVHPPLYYIILKLIINFTGYNLQVAKIVSILPILLMNLFITKLAFKNEKHSKDKNKLLLLAIFLIATNLTTNFLYMALEVRMYSWALFFVTISGLYAYKLITNLNKKNILIFVVFSLCAALTHYFALIMEVVIYIYLFIALLIQNKKNIKQVIIIASMTILGYIWWLPNAISQFINVKKNYWITFNVKDILGYIKNVLSINNDNKILIVIYVIILIEIILILYKLIIKKEFDKKEKGNVIFSLLAISLPFMIILIGILLNIFIRPIFIARYLMPSLSLYWLGIINLLNYIDYKKITIYIAIVIVLFMSLSGYINTYKKEMLTGTDNTIKFMNENSKQGEIITSNIKHLNWTVLQYYFPNNIIKAIEDVNLEENNIIWYFENVEQEIDKTYIKNKNFNIEKVYTGNIDNMYKFNIYKIYH